MKMQRKSLKNQMMGREPDGFTVVEVIVAASIMIILCVGTLSVFAYAVKINRGNNLRMQALTVLQMEVEYYRSLKFIPGLETTANLSAHRDTNLRVGSHALANVTTPDGRVFTVTSSVVNISPSGADEAHIKFKEITISAIPQVAESEAWLANLNTQVTIQRVRSN